MEKTQEQAVPRPTEIVRTDLQLEDLQALLPLLQPGLLRLNVSSNYLAAIPSLPASLRELNLSANRLSDIKALAGLPGLESLDLSFNRFATFEAVEIPNLETLDLANNKLTTIRSLEKLRNLSRIRLDCNLLKSLRFVSNNPKVPASYQVTEISASENCIADVKPSDLSALEALQTLDLSKNALREASFIANLPKIEVVLSQADSNALAQRD